MTTPIEATTTRARPGHCLLGALLCAALSLFLCATSAHAEVAKEAAWKIAAASGPTNLPPTQSEVQRLTEEAEGGTFTVATTLAKGQGKLHFAEAISELAEGSNRVHILFVLAGAFEVGQGITGPGIPAGATVTGISGAPGEVELELSSAATETTSGIVKSGSKEITEVTTSAGQFAVGQELSGTGVRAGTTITNVGSGTLTISVLPKGSGVAELTGRATTPAIAHDASATALQSALEALPGSTPGMFTVLGGPGGDAGHPYFVDFGGSFAEQDVPQLGANGEALTGQNHFASVSTVVPGGPGTGEIGIYLANIGGADSSGRVTVELGPLPSGIVTRGVPQGSEWTCEAETSRAICTTTANVRALHPALSISVPVEVTSPSVSTSVVPVRLADEHGHSASSSVSLVVSAEQAEPGLAGFWAGAFEANGAPSTQAGGHPYSDMTWFLPNTDRSGSGEAVPAGDPKDIGVELPAGFLGDPLSTGRCPQGQLMGGPGCPGAKTTPGSKSEAVLGEVGVNSNFATGGALATAIINDIPVEGAAAQFSTIIVQPVVSLLGSVRSESDYGVRITVPNAPTAFQKAYETITTFYGFPEGETKAFFRNPTDCAEEAREASLESLETNTWQQPASFDRRIEELQPVTGCDQLQFKAYDPSTGEGQVGFSFQPSSTQGSTGVGATAHLHIDQSGLTDPNKLGTPDLKSSVVTLPEGFDVNPAQANGLAACSEAQVGYEGEGALPNPTRFNNEPVKCPDGSKLGTAEISTPLLEESLQGTIYLAAQEENPFHSLIALYLVVESKRFGITLKLPGKVETDPSTGQVTAVFDYVPQQPVEDLTLHFRGGGPRSEFATPEVCGAYSTKAVWTPWSAPESGPPAQTESSFDVSSGCSSSATARPFAPTFEAGTTNPVAGSYSPLVIKVNRSDGEQELTSLNFTLPEGLIGNLASVPYCSDAAIEAARSKSGWDEQASPSCPAASQIGTVDAAAGVGSEPVHVGGHVYMAGPYEGAPLSAVVITPAVAGPFDLGDVVVRAPLFINSATAQITAKSDALPTILKGIPLKLRSVAITLDRPNFTLNPTSCAAMAVAASIGSSDGATATPSNRFQVGSCAGLPFKPALSASTRAKASKANGASLVVKIAAKPGEANIHKVNLQLPVALPSRLTTLQKACTEAQFNANPAGCPAGSVIGSATARTPILQVPLSGPAYLVSHGGAAFPDIEFVLQADERGGDIEIVLDGGTQIKKGVTYSRFETVPDAPISSFEAVLPQGPHSILGTNLPAAAGYDLCGQVLRMPTTLTGQNGTEINQDTPISVEGCSTTLSFKHGIKKRTLTLSVYAPAAGKITATGKGLTTKSKTAKAEENLTITLQQKHAGKLKTTVRVAFTPSTGKDRKKQAKTAKLTFKR